MQFTNWLTDHKPLAIGIGVTSLLVLILVLVVVLRPVTPKLQASSVTVISFNDGSNEVTVDRNGTVTIKTPFGTFTQFWDKEKVRNFFANIDNLDFESLTQYLGTELAISLTASSGQTLIIDASLLPEQILNEMQITLEDTYVEEEITVVKSTPIVFATIRPNTSSIPNSTATPRPNVDNPWHQGIEPEDAQPFSCEAYSVSGGRRVIVSNTLCGQ